MHIFLGAPLSLDALSTSLCCLPTSAMTKREHNMKKETRCHT